MQVVAPRSHPDVRGGGRWGLVFAIRDVVSVCNHPEPKATRSTCTGAGAALEEGRYAAAVLHRLDVRRRAELGGDVSP